MPKKTESPNLWRHPNGIYYVRAMVNGRRRKVSTGETAPGRAERRRDEIMKDWRDGVLGWKRATAPSFQRWWDTYAKTHLAQQSPGTGEVYSLAVNRLSPQFMRKGLDEITRTDCVRELNAFKREYAVSTVETTYVVLRGVMEAARKDKLIAENPWQDIEVERPKGRLRVTTLEEDEELLGALSPYHGRWYRVLLGTGLRISELTGLVPSRIHWDAELLTVKGKGSKKHRGGKWRDVPMMPEVAELLREQIAERGIAKKPHTHLWTEVTETFDGQLRRRCQDLGMPLVTPHTCRHTFATRYMQSNGNIYFLSQILGHSSVAVTEKMYVHASKQSMVDDLKRVWTNMVQGMAPGRSEAQTPFANESAFEPAKHSAA
jgi:integrase